MNDLPPEIYLLIFGQVSFQHFGVVSAVCKSFCQFIYGTDALWKPSFELLYGGPISTETIDSFYPSCTYRTSLMTAENQFNEPLPISFTHVFPKPTNKNILKRCRQICACLKYNRPYALRRALQDVPKEGILHYRGPFVEWIKKALYSGGVEVLQELEILVGSFHEISKKFKTLSIVKAGNKAIDFALTGRMPISVLTMDDILKFNSSDKKSLQYYIEKGGIIDASPSKLTFYSNPADTAFIVDFFAERCSNQRDLQGAIVVLSHTTALLSFIISKGTPEQIQYLISIGADIYNSDTVNDALFGNLKVLQYLFAMDVKVEYLNLSRYQAALYSRGEQLLELFAEYGKPVPVDKTFHYAAQTNNFKIIEKLIERVRYFLQLTKQGSIDTTSYEFRKLLFTASSHEAIMFLLQHGAPIDTKKDGIQPIHLAAQQGDISRLQLLVKQGADINTTDDAGRTPLHHAAQSAGDFKVFQELLELGSNFKAVDEKGYTVIHYLARRNHRFPVQCFMRVDLDKMDNSGKTALMIAIEERKYVATTELIFHGASPPPKDFLKDDAMRNFYFKALEELNYVIPYS